MDKAEIITLIVLSLIIALIITHIIKRPDSISKEALSLAVKQKDSSEIKKIIKYRTAHKGGRKYRNSTGYGANKT